jgi:phage terminase large subunit-like protein
VQHRPRTGRKRPAPTDRLTPFTLPHFVAWAKELTLDNGEPWIVEDFQAAFVADVFLKIPECWLVVPEENAKTTLVAGLALYHCEFKGFSYVPVAASSREQAQLPYSQAAGFVDRSSRLKKLFTCLEGYRRIRCDSMNSRIQVFAADEKTGDGIIPTLCLVDELHRHRDLKLYRTWSGKLGKRGGQIVAISTSGEPGSEFEDTREIIRQQGSVTRNGSFLRSVSASLVLHEWAVPEKANVEDLELVKAANPLKAITIPMLKRKWESPTMTLAHWRRFVCNLPTRSERSAIQEAEWHAAKTTEQIPEGQAIWVGLDVAWKWDTTAAVPFWQRDDHFRLFGAASILVPPRDGSSLDPNLVEKALIDIHHRNPIHTVVMDLTRAEQLGTWIEHELGATVIDRAQSNQFAVQDYEKFMEGLRGGQLKHSGDAGLTAHALHAIARVLPDGKARFDRPSQTREGGDQDRRVIDALSAAAMVYATAVTLEPEPVFAFAVR